MVVFELLTVAGAGYTGYSAWLMSRFYRAAAAHGTGLNCIDSSIRGVEFYRLKWGFHELIDVIPGSSGLPIPMCGGLAETREFVFSRWHFMGVGKDKLINGLRASYDPTAIKKWINTAEEFDNNMRTHGISAPKQEFPTKLPLRMVEFVWNGPVWYDLPSAVVSRDRAWVARKAAWARRLPYTFVVAGATVLCAGGLLLLPRAKPY